MFKNIVLSAACVALCSSGIEPPKPLYPIPTAQQIEWQKMERYAFVHFGLNTFNDLEWGFGDTPSSTFNPTHLDAEQWVRTIKAAGFKAVILTAKHHDGFNLWQSKHTEYSVKNSPWKNGKGDMVRELIDACKKHNLKVGLYLSPWDRNHAQYGQPGYVEYFHKQIQELISEYCNDIDMFEYWFDGANGGDGYYGGAREKRNINATQYYQYQKAVDIIHEKFPKAMIFGGTAPTIRWIGNESGWAGQTNWAMLTKSTSESSQYQYGDIDGKDWLPGEVDVSIRPGWFYHSREDHQVRSLSNLVNIYYQSVGRNANLLLNFPVSLRGTIHPVDSARVMEFSRVIDDELKTNLLKGAKVQASNSRGDDFAASKVNDNNWDSYWATQDGVVKAELIFTFSKPMVLNRLMLQEYIALGQRVKSFSVDYLSKGEWRPITTTDSMTTIGYKRIIRFENITAEKLRVNFTDARAELTINNIEAFFAPTLMVEPVIIRDKNGMVTIKGGDISAKVYYTTDGSEPSPKSTLYTAPFESKDKVTIKSITQDPESTKRLSPISTKQFDVLTTAFKVNGGKNAPNMVDSNPASVYMMEDETNSVTITLDQERQITGFTYLPDQSRWGGGVVTLYELWVGDKMVAQGEFSNIKSNPIEQTVMLAEPIKATQVRFVAKAVINGKRAAIAEFGIITK